jgi:hypothetical protein|nr:MAG TPA: protein of unknown function (DUF4519) [Caudoviricetes sp.]
MEDVLQALAKMLNMTTDEVSSLLSTFKGNAPQIYETLIKEKMMYDTFSFLQLVFSILAVISLGILIITIIEYYKDDDVYYWEYEDNEERKEVKERKKENRRKDLNRPLKIVLFTTSTSFLLYIIFSVLKIVLTPNYTFIVNEVLPRLTNR